MNANPTVTRGTHMRALSLFAGPGGFSLGLQSLGIPDIGIEWDQDAVATRTAAGMESIHGDVRNYSPATLPKCEVLTAGPPCPAFSSTGKGEGRRMFDVLTSEMDRYATGDLTPRHIHDDERIELVLEPLRFMLQGDYTCAVWEQVPPVLPLWEHASRILEGKGYHTFTGVVTASDYGVPQSRRRAVLLASRTHAPELPTPTSPHGWGTVLDGTLLESNYSGPTVGGRRVRGTRTPDKPAFTVTSKSMRVDDRTLTPSEMALLQGFPEEYPWQGTVTAQRLQIGNAVPPPMAAALVNAVLPQ